MSVRVSVTVRVSLVWRHRHFLFRKISKWHGFSWDSAKRDSANWDSAKWDSAKWGITAKTHKKQASKLKLTPYNNADQFYNIISIKISAMQKSYQFNTNHRLLRDQLYTCAWSFCVQHITKMLITDNHSLHGSISPMLAASGLVNGQWQTLTPKWHPSSDHLKTHSWYWRDERCAKFAANPSMRFLWKMVKYM